MQALNDKLENRDDDCSALVLLDGSISSRISRVSKGTGLVFSAVITDVLDVLPDSSEGETEICCTRRTLRLICSN